MMSLKTWTYADITAEAERQITQARSDADTAPPGATRAMNNDFAMGAYLFWLALTKGTHNADDVVALRALAKDGLSNE